MRRSIHGASRSRSHDDRGPRESFVVSRCGAGTYGRASPSLRHHPRNDFLILIVGNSHLDCRAAAGTLSASSSGRPTIRFKHSGPKLGALISTATTSEPSRVGPGWLTPLRLLQRVDPPPSQEHH